MREREEKIKGLEERERERERDEEVNSRKKEIEGLKEQLET